MTMRRPAAERPHNGFLPVTATAIPNGISTVKDTDMSLRDGSTMGEQDQNSVSKTKISLEEYLQEVARFCEDEYGTRFREQFEDSRGTSELAMLVVPTAEELGELRKAVAIMTPTERHNADRLSDEQMAGIAQDARIDPANFAIFINGYALTCKRVS
jgi:hypothetical protein